MLLHVPIQGLKSEGRGGGMSINKCLDTLVNTLDKLTLLPSLSGGSPFLVDSLDLTRDNIRSARFSLSSKYFSDQTKDLISKLLVKDGR